MAAYRRLFTAYGMRLFYALELISTAVKGNAVFPDLFMIAYTNDISAPATVVAGIATTFDITCSCK